MQEGSWEDFMGYVFMVISDILHFTDIQGFSLRLNLLQQALAGKLRELGSDVTKDLLRCV